MDEVDPTGSCLMYIQVQKICRKYGNLLADSLFFSPTTNLLSTRRTIYNTVGLTSRLREEHRASQGKNCGHKVLSIA